MKNKEKYADDIVRIAITRQHLAMKNGKMCTCIEIDCKDCDFSIDNNKKCVFCSDFIPLWVEQEYIEPKPKLTKREKAFIDCVVSDFNIVRLADNSIWFGLCESRFGAELDGEMFKFVKKRMSKKELLEMEVEE